MRTEAGFANAACREGDFEITSGPGEAVRGLWAGSPAIGFPIAPPVFRRLEPWE